MWSVDRWGAIRMNGSVRAVFTAGVVALTGGALVVSTPLLPTTVEVIRPVVNTAGVATLAPPVEPPSADEFRSALALVGQLAQAPIGADEPPVRVAAAAFDDPAVLDTASTVIDDVYSVARYWANYVALDLGPWLLNWVPLGYLISDQIHIWYPDLVLPTVDSFVYDFLDPVVNDALNPAVWLDGINAVVRTAANGVVNGIVDEIDYVLSLGWFPIPLPPLPTPPLPRLASESTPAVTVTASSQFDEIVTDTTDGPLADAAPQASVEQIATEKVDETETDPVAEVQAPGDSGSAAESVKEPASDSEDEEPQEVADDKSVDDPSDADQPDADQAEGEGAEQESAAKTAETSSADTTADNSSDTSGENGSGD